MTIRRIKEGHVFRKPNAKSGVCMIGAKKQHISNQELTIYYDMRPCENSFSVPVTLIRQRTESLLAHARFEYNKNNRRKHYASSGM